MLGRRQLAVALTLVACGRVDGGSDDSNESDGTGGVDSAGGSASGPSATGGSGATDTGAGGASTGGLASYLPEPWSPCHQYEYVELDPPCGESDIIGNFSVCGLWFDVPLAQVEPPALGLEVVLLPLGLGGMGGVPTEPLSLDPILDWSLEPSAEGDEKFDLPEPAPWVRAGYWHQGLPPGYVTVAEDINYGVAKVALLEGDETLSVHRGLFSTPQLEFCVK